MKSFWYHLTHLIVNISFMSASLAPATLSAQVNSLLEKQMSDCANNSSMEWSSTTNKCVEKEESLKQRNEANACNEKKDLAQREACHKSLAEHKTGLSSDPNKLSQGNTTASMVINSAYSVVTLINFTGKDNAKSNCLSKKIFGVTAVAGLASDVYLKVMAQKKVNALNNKFKLDVAAGASDSQVKALEYLKEEQKTVVDIAELEKKRNIVLTLGYGAAGLLAAYELSPWGKNPSCEMPSEKTEANAQSAKAEPVAERPSSTQQAAEANGTDTPDSPVAVSQDKAPSPPTAGITESAGAAISKIKGLTDNSLGIMVLAGIGTVYSGVLISAAAEQESESKENIQKIDKVIKTFKDSYANFCPNGRENLTEPKCYCYNANGTQNNNRTNSQTCTALWAQNNYKLEANAANYAGVSTFVDPVGCVTLNGQFDEKCTCKKFVDGKGSNACMKTTNITIPVGLGSGFGSASGLQQVTNFSNNAANGNPRFDLLSSGQLGTNAIAAKKMAQEVFTKLSPQLPASAIVLSKMNDKNVGQYARSVFGEKAIQAAARGPSSAIGLASSRSTDGKVAALLKDAEKKAGLDLMGSGKGLAQKKLEGKEAPNFNFIGETNTNANGAQTQNFPEKEKNYNYKNNDISKRDDTSIFEIISNRYVQSGLRRLFDN